ncbi:MAG: LamG-like jellyroll fold domain-containing protein [Kiritimatiellia bacterium]
MKLRFSFWRDSLLAKVLLPSVSMGPQVAPADALTNGLVAYYPLNGNVLDASGNGYTGNNFSAVSVPSGRKDGCYEFNGSSTAVVVYDAALRNRFPASSAITISAWVKVRAFHTDFTIIAAMDSGRYIQTRASLRLNALGVPHYYSRGVGFNTVFSDLGALETNRWYQLTSVHTGSVARLYVDGVLAGESFSFTPLPAPHVPTGGRYVFSPPYADTYSAASIGSWTDWPPDSGFNGWIDEVRYYNRGLSPTEVGELYRFAAPVVINSITVLTDRASISVPEGGTSSFQVKLSAQPTGDTVVAVARSTGDTDITVSENASLTFSTANWADYQFVNLASDEDNDDNQNGTATITCSSPDIASAVVDATEADDDYTLTGTSLYGTIIPNPDTPYYDNGTEVALTAVPNPSYFFTEWTGGLADTNNPAAILMDSDKSVTASYAPVMPEVLTPSKIGKNAFTARWKWVEGGAPEGELSVILDVEGFPEYVPGYRNRYLNNVTECVVTNLLSGKDYWYRVRRLMPDGSRSMWSSDMKVRTGKGMPVFKNLLSDVSVSKGISQEFALTNLTTGTGTLKVKSSNTAAVNPVLSAETLTLQYLWKAADSAKVTLVMTHPTTGYKVSYGVALNRAGGSVAVVGQSALTNAGTVVAQEVTLQNQTGGMIGGVRVRAFGLDNQDWLVNRTGLDPVSKTAIVELPCVLPAGSQMVVRMVYNLAYKKQSKTKQVTCGAWAIMPPLSGAMPVSEDLTIAQKDLYDGLWLLGMPANRNRLYAVYHSDDGGDSWVKEAAVLRATGNYLMWMDTDEGAPEGRLYRVLDEGM